MEVKELEITLNALVQNSSPSFLLCAVHNIFAHGRIYDDTGYSHTSFWQTKDNKRFEKLMIHLEKSIKLAKKLESD